MVTLEGNIFSGPSLQPKKAKINAALNKILKEISKKNYIKRKPKLIRIDD